MSSLELLSLALSDETPSFVACFMEDNNFPSLPGFEELKKETLPLNFTFRKKDGRDVHTEQNDGRRSFWNE